MTLAFVIKCADGIVLAADSRTTVDVYETKGEKTFVRQYSFDNTSKLFRIPGQDHIGLVTHGEASINTSGTRPISSFIPEFTDTLRKKGRLSVENVAKEFSSFIQTHWNSQKPEDKSPLNFFVAGLDKQSPHGRIFGISLPQKPEPSEWHKGAMTGYVYGGSSAVLQRILDGIDAASIGVIKAALPPEEWKKVEEVLSQFLLPISYAWFGLQDCVDFAITLIRTTLIMDKWQISSRMVGGPIDIATITRAEGFSFVQAKSIRGEAA